MHASRCFRITFGCYRRRNRHHQLHVTTIETFEWNEQVQVLMGLVLLAAADGKNRRVKFRITMKL